MTKKRKDKPKARICSCGRITLKPVCDRCAAARVASVAIAQAAR